MSEFFFSVALNESRSLCLAPLTDRCIEESGQILHDISGYFLFEKNGTGDRAEIEILAQAISDEAAQRLSQLFQMQLQPLT